MGQIQERNRNIVSDIESLTRSLDLIRMQQQKPQQNEESGREKRSPRDEASRVDEQQWRGLARELEALQLSGQQIQESNRNIVSDIESLTRSLDLIRMQQRLAMDFEA